ncbi:MAG: glutamate 5-kinase [Candidatus Omnitrophota bacterium]
MDIKLKKGDKIVVKVGSSILTSHTGKMDMKRLEMITSGVIKLKIMGFDVVIVSSGAIACGMEKLALSERPTSMLACATAAAVGQSVLMFDYEQLFRKNNYLTAQILLTSDCLENRTRYLNARNTLLSLLQRDNIVPIVNENDAVVTDEIKFGDNDKLSAQVAALIDAQLLIILSDVDGFYDPQGNVISRIENVDSCISSFASDTVKKTTVGGMITKLEAAKIAVNAGIPMVIANGQNKDILEQIVKEQTLCTWFLPKKDKMSGKKRWIAFSCKNCGKIIIDEGAKQALLKKGKSLLAIGITAVVGAFSFGDLVIICDEHHNEIARGLVNYSSEEVSRIKQAKTADIEEILGCKSYDEVVHRNNLVILR